MRINGVVSVPIEGAAVDAVDGAGSMELARDVVREDPLRALGADASLDLAPLDVAASRDLESAADTVAASCPASAAPLRAQGAWVTGEPPLSLVCGGVPTGVEIECLSGLTPYFIVAIIAFLVPRIAQPVDLASLQYFGFHFIVRKTRHAP